MIIKQIYTFIKHRSKFFLKKFLFIYLYKIADFEISKKELRVRLKSIYLICDACIVSLPHECESSSKKSFFFTLSKNSSDFFYKSNLIFYLTKIDLIFTNPILFFLSFKKIDLIFINQISFFILQENRFDFSWSNLIFFLYKNIFDFYKSNLIFFFFNFQNRANFSFKRGYIHKTNLFNVIFVKCLSHVL